MNRKNIAATTEEFTWENVDVLDETGYIVYHGKGTAQHQFVKLTCPSQAFEGNNSPKSFISTTGERVTLTKDGINVIPRERLWIGEEIEEVDFEYDEWNLINRGLSEIKLQVRGIDISDNENFEYQPLYATNQKKKNGEKASLRNFDIDLSKASLGQTRDILEHQKKYQSLVQTHPRVRKKIAFGISRGAATTFASIAVHKDDYQLCILEGPPASMSDVIKNYTGKYLSKKLYNRFLADRIVGEEHSLEKEAQAQAYIGQFPDNIPLTIVTSKKDDLVPHQSSLKFAMRVAANRLKKKIENPYAEIAPVYLIQLDDSSHNDYTTNKSIDSQRYQNACHAIYEQHNLPYIKKYANQGRAELKTAELTTGLLNEFILLQDDFKNNKDENQRINLRVQAFKLFNQKFNINSEYEDINFKDKLRAASICAAMPLFAKQIGNSDNNKLTIEELCKGELPESLKIVEAVDINEKKIIEEKKPLSILPISSNNNRIFKHRNQVEKFEASDCDINTKEIIRSINSINMYLKIRSKETNTMLFGYSCTDYLERRNHWVLILESLLQANSPKDLDIALNLIDKSIQKFDRLLSLRSDFADSLKILYKNISANKNSIYTENKALINYLKASHSAYNALSTHVLPKFVDESNVVASYDRFNLKHHR